MQKIQISPGVALVEATALAEHYRNRALMHAQNAHELKVERQQLQAQAATEGQREAEHDN